MANKEYKIGERFQCGNVTLEAVKGDACVDCFFNHACLAQSECEALVIEMVGHCNEPLRSDNTNIIFKKVNDMENKNYNGCTSFDSETNRKMYLLHHTIRKITMQRNICCIIALFLLIALIVTIITFAA